MGATHSSNIQAVSTDTSHERTLCVTPSELLSTCATLTRAQIKVLAATTPPSHTGERALIWVENSEQLNSMLESGGLGQNVAPFPYTSKGSKVMSLDEHTTVMGMIKKCEEMRKRGYDIVACSNLVALGPKKIYLR